MTEHRPCVEDILDSFFARRLAAASGVKRRRTEATEVKLRGYLETGLDGFLSEEEKSLLDSEREFSPVSAFARLMGADMLIYALPKFVTAPWLAGDRMEMMVQIETVDRLAGTVIQDKLIDQREMWSALGTLRAALDEGKWEANRERREKRLALRRAEADEIARRLRLSHADAVDASGLGAGVAPRPQPPDRPGGDSA